MDDNSYASTQKPGELFQLAEIQVVYKPKIKARDRPQVCSSDDAFQIFRQFWSDTLDYQESLYVMVLNKANRVLGIHLHSVGSQIATIASVGQIMAVILRANGVSLIVAHNHPSMNLRPSGADLELTRKLKQAAQLLDLQLMDHLIICDDGYYSFADEGEL